MEKAMSVVDQAIRQHRYSGILHKRKAELLLNKQSLDLALESLDRALVFGQSAKEVDLLRTRAFILQENFDKAVELLNDLRCYEYLSREERGEMLYMESCIYEKQGDYEHMHQSLRDALLENPNHSRALERFWAAVEFCRRHRDSIDLHNYILDLNPYNYRAWFNIGHAYYSTNRYKEAMQAFEYAFLINEKFELAYRDYAEVCFEVQAYEEALKCYKEALEHFEADADVLAKIGQCLLYTDQTAKAKIYFFRALGLDQRNDEVYYYIGECYAAEKQWTSAVHFYRQAIRLDEEREDYRFSLAKAYHQLGRHKKAIPLFAHVVETAPEQTHYWTSFAQFYLDLGQLDEAMSVIEDAEINSFGADIYYCKAALLFLEGDKTSALESLREGLTEDFHRHDFFFRWVPHVKDDKDVQAIIKYFRFE
ncbi:MAG: tetratricopeptide repeat protein [Bacteroidota bacterium]